MTLDSLEELQRELDKPLTLVLAKTHPCSVCKNTLSILQANVPKLSQLNIVEIYIDDHDEYRGKFMIFTVPTVMIYSEGKELLRASRFIDTGKINRLLEMFGA